MNIKQQMDRRRFILAGSSGLFAAAALNGCSAETYELPATHLPYQGFVSPDFVLGEAPEVAQRAMTAHRKSLGAPSFSAAVAHRGDILWAGASGFANVEREIPARLDTRYRIGSTSKAVTATLTARMREAGLIDLDEPIQTYMPDVAEHWRRLTLRQLHSHTAGIPGYENNSDLWGKWLSWRRQKHYSDVVHALEQFDDAALLYPPGEGFYYSSFDVVLASAVLQSAAQRPFLELLEIYVTQPLGVYMISADYAEKEVPHRAQFYDLQKDGVRRARSVDLSSRWASGGLVSTSSDLAKLGCAYFDPAFLSPITRQEWWTPQRLKNGDVNEQFYALGWRSQRANSKTFGREVWLVHHGGISVGAMSWLVVYPEYELSVAINMNTQARDFAEFSAVLPKIAKGFVDRL